MSWPFRSAVFVAVVALVASCPRPALAQTASGEVAGLVRDQAGDAVPGASITVTDIRTNRQRVVVSDADGRYTAPSLAPGEYRLDLSLAGFKAVRRDGLRLSTGEKARVDIDLEVGDVREQVTVVAGTPAVRSTASLGTVIEHEQVVQLPLNGRLFILLAGVAPGVSLPPNSVLPRINGGRPRTNEYLFDGISVLQPEPGQIAYSPIVDAIQEFKIESNSPPAEFGRFNGGVVNLTTRAGGNAFQGAGWEFFRHEALNARNAFQTANARTPEYRRHQYGGLLGGPVVRDRTFFFADYQGQRQRIARTVTSTVPTALQRQGVFTEAIAGRVPAIYDPTTTAGTTRAPFPGHVIPRSAMDPVALALISRYPQPTSTGTANNYRRTGDEIVDQDQGDIRVDHTFGAGRDLVFARLTHARDRAAPVAALPDGSGAMPAGSVAPGPQTTRTWAFASSHRHIFSGTLVNELRVGDTRRGVERTAAVLDGPAGTTLGIPGLPVSGAFANTIPTFIVNGYQQLGSPASTATTFSTGVTQVSDTLTWLKGRHTMKAGVDWRWSRLDVVQPPRPTGAFTFGALGSDLPGVTGTGNAFASFLLGQVQSFSIDVQAATIQQRARVQEYFVQDDWRVSDRLTLSPGLRYTLNFPSVEKNGQTAVFNLQTRQLDYPGARPVRPLQKTNVGPRLGVVFRATDTTIASAGYGLVWIEMTGITTPFTTPTFPFLQEVTQRTLDNITPAFLLSRGPSVSPVTPSPLAGLGQGVFTVDRTLGSGYAQQWNVSLQRQIGVNTAIELSYLGSRITRAGIPDSNVNQLTEAQLRLGPQLLTRVPNPFFGVVPRTSSIGGPTITVAQLLTPYPQYTAVSFYRNNVGVSRYAGVALSLRRRLARGLSYSAAYTRSRLEDTASSVFDASILTGPLSSAAVADAHNLRRDYDVSTGDIPHALASSIVWELPVGRGRRWQPGGVIGAVVNDWSLAAVVTRQSGTPVAVTQANTLGYAGFTTQRPNLAGDPALPASERSTARWFDTTAFSAADQFSIGTASRNPVRGPGYRNVDLAVSRLVRLGGTRALDLRVEVFNLANTANLGAPAAQFGAADFGTITSALDPRVVQLAVKVTF